MDSNTNTNTNTKPELITETKRIIDLDKMSKREKLGHLFDMVKPKDCSCSLNIKKNSINNMIDVCIIMIQKFKVSMYEQHCKGKHLDTYKVFRDLEAHTQYYKWACSMMENEPTFRGFVSYIEHLEKENEKLKSKYIDYDYLLKENETLKEMVNKMKNDFIEPLLEENEKLKSGTTKNDTEIEIEHFFDLDNYLYPEGLDWTYDKPNEPHLVVYIIKKKEETESDSESSDSD